MLAKYITSTILAGALALQGAAPANARGGDEGPTFFIVIENGGVVTDPEGQIDAARLTFLRLIGIGPFIHAGYPCDEGDGLIKLPQAVPAEVQLGAMAVDASFLRLLNVHADQDEMVLEHLEGAGVLERVTAGALDFDLMDRARTRSNLGNILGRD